VKEGRGGGVFIICVVGKKKQEENTLGVGRVYDVALWI
jgi:hypothetical protein